MLMSQLAQVSLSCVSHQGFMVTGAVSITASGSDYVASSIRETLTFPAGTTERCIDVAVINDTVNERDETFVILVRVQGSPDVSATTQVTIEDDDGK